jgi:hypothetical protein
MNERENAIELDGISFLGLEIAQTNRDKLLGVIVNTKQQYRLHREQIEAMLISRWTFGRAIEQVDVRAKCYLFQVRKEIFEQLEGLGL